MGDRSYDVIVLGVGTMGSAVCSTLARRGVKVLGLERFDIPHALGAHHGHSRMFRLAYFEHPDYVPLLRRSLEGWRELNERSELAPFVQAGGIYIGAPDSDLIAQSGGAAREHGIEHQMLSRQELGERYPQFQAPDDFVGMFEPNAGYVVPEHAVAAYACEALALGADLRGQTPVESWTPDGDGVTVTAGGERFSAGSLIVCAGAWSGPFLAQFGVEINVTRQALGWLNPPDPAPFRTGVSPCWAVRHADGHLYYGFPMRPSNPGLKVARHWVGQTTDPDTVERRPQPSDEDEFRPFVREYLPQADGPLLSLAICIYANTADGHFVLDRHPEHENVVFGAGFSGHGFKFAPVVGEALADLATEGGSDLPIGFLGLSRFAN